MSGCPPPTSRPRSTDSGSSRAGRQVSSGTPPGIHGIALAGLLFNLTAGFSIFALLRIPWHGEAPDEIRRSLVLALVAWAFTFIVIRRFRPFITNGRFPPRRWWAALLLGASFAVLLWHPHQDPAEQATLAIGFLIRWCLLAGEIREMREMDRRRLCLPSLAARIRFGITMITGAVIPLLLLANLAPGGWLILVSFLLTAFSQWTAIAEMHYHLSRPRETGGDALPVPA